MSYEADGEKLMAEINERLQTIANLAFKKGAAVSRRETLMEAINVAKKNGAEETVFNLYELLTKCDQ